MPRDIGIYLDAQIPWLILPSTATAIEVPNFFIMDMPDLPDMCVAIYQYSGEGPEQTYGNPSLIKKPRLQVVVRSFRSDDALMKSEEIYDCLKMVKNQIINGIEYLRISPVSEPQELGPDSGNRQRVSCNYSVWKLG